MAHLRELLLSGVLFIPATVSAADFSGPVVSVLDGDIIEVFLNNHAQRVRLHGIDCPEKGQPYGQKAKQLPLTSSMGRKSGYGKDKYRRTLTDVLLPYGTNVNHELVKERWCRWYRENGNCPRGYHSPLSHQT